MIQMSGLHEILNMIAARLKNDFDHSPAGYTSNGMVM
jgi:hypothetical protein